MTGKGGKGLLAGKTTAAAAATKEKDKKKSISRSARAGLQENKEYKEYRDKGCREVSSYKLLFGDAFDRDKYVVTPSQICRTGFDMFEDSGYEDLRDAHPGDEESSGSSDEGDKNGRAATNMDVSRLRSGDKRRSGSKNTNEKRAKIGARDLSYSVDCVASASLQEVEKIDILVGPVATDAKTLMIELLATNRLQKKTDLYFWTCKFLSKRANREILDIQDDADEKMDWIEWCWREDRRRRVE